MPILEATNVIALMMNIRVFSGLARKTALLCLLSAGAAWADPVLMISIDGLKPEYITHADEHGLHIPNLRRFVQEGTYADGVIPVLPTVTYPDHTTLITGVWPTEHGIINNPLFDPDHNLAGAWYWYAESIKVPTLWDAAHQAGISTASISWPVSVNATSVDTLIPEFWRTNSPAIGGNDQDRYLMNAVSRPDNMLDEMEKRLGPYMRGNDTTVERGDTVRTRFALDILENKKPGFMTVHLSAMDESEHLHGPFSPEANQTLEAVDGMVGQLMQAALANDPKTKIVIVSDHGFVAITHSVNIYIPFLEAGLMQLPGKRTGIEAMLSASSPQPWKVEFNSAGGVTAIMLHDPADTATKEKVHTLLTRLASDPNNGIESVLDEKQIAEREGFPGASYLIVMKPGYTAGAATSGPLVTGDSPLKGSHGFWPLYPEMRSSFFVLGQGVAQHRDLGVIDMRQIAPTVAGVLGVGLPTAKQPKLQIEQ
jgi:predicted AlkP superfamily pyrophosphatase or phosphodiesterase